MSYPQQRIDFSKDNIPVNILQIFTEAVTCHSNECFIAAGMMIRKTLEAICEDKRATGANLHQKLESLKKLITVPTELLEAMYELKLLGNDAAHIVAKDFEEIGNEEIEISIEFAKEILKSVYQYQSLLSKLRGLKKPTI
ncbi:DUF4145 domain-containing protein [Mucilaginibacter gilvus]|nr:DUF4145 domain-containing protein [Mucilaginibacter gilvus]